MRTRLGAKQCLVRLMLAVLFLLLGVQPSQTGIPIGFERVRDHAIGRIYIHVPTACKFSFVARAFQLFLAHDVGLFDAPCDLAVNGQRDVDGGRRDR